MLLAYIGRNVHQLPTRNINLRFVFNEGFLRTWKRIDRKTRYLQFTLNLEIAKLVYKSYQHSLSIEFPNAGIF